MTSKRKPSVGGRPTPAIEASDLRRPTSDAAVERVWRRLDASLDEAAAPRRAHTGLWWGVAVAAATFGGGVWVGRLSMPAEPSPLAQMSAEPNRASGQTSPMTADRRGDPRDSDWSSEQPPLVVAPPDLEEVRGDDAEPIPSVTRRASRRGRVPLAESDEVVAPVVPGPVFPGNEDLGPMELVPAPSAESAPPSAEPPQWQRLANAGDYEAALFVLSQVGGFEAALQDSSPEQLMLLVDVARATGQRHRAIAALRRVVDHHPGDPVAPLAAWSLGDLLERAGDRKGAVQAFAAYRALSPEGDFAEDALVRELRSAVERRAVGTAKALAAQYERDFPEGGRSEEVARWVSQLEFQVVEDGDAGVPTDVSDEAEVLGEDESGEDAEQP